MNYSLYKNDTDSPILNKTSVKQFKATFQKNCGPDDICKSKLILNARPLSLNGLFITDFLKFGAKITVATRHVTLFFLYRLVQCSVVT